MIVDIVSYLLFFVIGFELFGFEFDVFYLFGMLEGRGVLIKVMLFD